MAILKFTLLFLAILFATNIVTSLVQISIVLKNKGKANISPWYFSVQIAILAASVAALVVIW